MQQPTPDSSIQVQPHVFGPQVDYISPAVQRRMFRQNRFDSMMSAVQGAYVDLSAQTISSKELLIQHEQIAKEMMKCSRLDAECEQHGDLDEEHRGRSRNDFFRAKQAQKMLISRSESERLLKKIQKKDRMRRQVRKCLEVQRKELYKLLSSDSDE